MNIWWTEKSRLKSFIGALQIRIYAEYCRCAPYFFMYFIVLQCPVRVSQNKEIYFTCFTHRCIITRRNFQPLKENGWILGLMLIGGASQILMYFSEKRFPLSTVTLLFLCSLYNQFLFVERLILTYMVYCFVSLF